MGVEWFFRPAQTKILDFLHQGKSVLCVLPTGQGKSELFTFPLLCDEVSAMQMTVNIIFNCFFKAYLNIVLAANNVVTMMIRAQSRRHCRLKPGSLTVGILNP